MDHLKTYDPDWEEKYVAAHNSLPAIWQRAVAEVRTFRHIDPRTKAEYISVIETMRRIRQRQYKTPADVAKRVFNIVTARATLVGEKVPQFPDAQSFSTLRQVREYLYSETVRLREAQQARRAKFSTQALPVMPKGEGGIFDGTNDFDLFSQAFLVPDIKPETRTVWVNGKAQTHTVADSEAFILTSERTDDARYICIGTRRHPDKFEGSLPELASKIYSRLFKSEDASEMKFFVHYPAGYGRDGGEQYWEFDLRPDARGQFTFHGKRPLPMVPYGIANKRMNDGERENNTQVITIPEGYDPYIASWAAGMVAQQEGITAKRRNAPRVH